MTTKKSPYKDMTKMEYQKKWREKNPLNVKHSILKHKFGIYIDDYYHMLREQNETCAICKQPETVRNNWSPTGVRSLSIDHCHTSGKIRGLLCYRCNMMLGYAKDNAETLSIAIEYLKK